MSDSARRARVAAVSHELRAPLSGVASLASLLLDEGGLTERQTELLGVLRRSARDVVQLLDDRLSYEKLEADAVQLEIRAFDLARRLDDLVTLLGATYRSEQTALRVQYPEGTPRLFVTDPTRLGQVLTNLVTNALKFTPRGAVTIRVAFEPRAFPDGDLVIKVIDTGIGISPERVAALFDPFTQADAATERRYGGTGLGLAITRRAVDVLGGTIEVVSQPNSGTMFTVRVPTAVADQPTDPTRDLTIDPALGEGVRALLVDDDPLSLYVAEELLAACGCSVASAETGLGALERADHEAFDVVFLDARLPDLSGYDVARALRARFGEALRIVALTGETDAKSRARAEAAGMNAHVAKPVTLEKIEATLRGFGAR